MDWIKLGRMTVASCFLLYHFDINRLNVLCV